MNWILPKVLVLAVVLALTLSGGLLAHGIYQIAEFQKWARDAILGDPVIWFILFAYVVLIAVPFVPGAELGLLLIAVFGVPIVGHVYLATVLALVLSFSVGRCVPESMLFRILTRLDARALLNGSDNQRSSGRPWVDRILQHRCVTLIILINTPGNSLLGGGGGIALAAGASRLFSWREFVSSVLIGVAPVPMIVLFRALVS